MQWEHVCDVFFDYHLNNTTLGTKVFHLDLGIIISEDLTWKGHHIMKAYKILGLLRRTFCNVCVQAKKAPVLVSSAITIHVLLTSVASTLH